MTKNPTYLGPRLAGLSLADHECTLEEVAQEMGISRERVRQLESKALRKAHKILTQRGYSLADFVESARHG